MKQSWEAGNYDAYSRYLFYVIATLEYNECTTELAPLFEQTMANCHTALEKSGDSRAVSTVLDAADMVGGGCGLLADEAMADHYEEELKRLSAMPGITDRIRCALLMRAACTKLRCAPTQAQAGFEAVLRQWPEQSRDTYYYMAVAYVEGLKKGLSGEALGEHVYSYVAARYHK